MAQLGVKCYGWPLTLCLQVWSYEIADLTANLVELTNAHEDRLTVLRLQAAQYGRSTPAEIKTEIASIERELIEIADRIARNERLETKWLSRIQQPATASAGDLDPQIANQVAAVGRYVVDLQESVSRESGAIIRLLSRSGDEDAAERRRRQRMTNLFYVVITLLVLTDILLRLFV